MEWYSWILLAFIASSFVTITVGIREDGLIAFWEETKRDLLEPIWNGVKALFLLIVGLGLGWIFGSILKVNDRLEAKRLRKQQALAKPDQPSQPL